MFGFSYIESNNKKYHFPEESYQTVSGIDFIARNQLIDKFADDKVFFDNDNYLIILDGVVINKKKLLAEARENNWADYIRCSYETKGETFFDEFRGSFSGVVKDKLKQKTIIFSDHIGTKFLYYIKQDDFFYVTSFMPNTYHFMKENGIDYKMSREGAYMLLTFGYMIEDNTICDKVKKLFPGHYITIQNGNIQEKEFCHISNKKENISVDDAVELIDSHFRRACKDEFEKDDEYSYEHFVNLSGGLDSRMTSLVADDLGFKKQMNVTFSQSGYWDEIIPQQITEDYKHDWIFKNLDSGLWLLDFEEVIKRTGGNVLYHGQAHGRSLMNNLNTSSYGIDHTGQLGDVFVGRTYAGKPINHDFDEYKMTDGAYSRKLTYRLQDYNLKYEYENREIGVLYNRGFNGINNGIVPLYEFIETFSPFLDIDFIKSSLKIPVCWENKNLVYEKWIEKKYPDFLKYGWEKLQGHRINEKKIELFGRKFYKDEFAVLLKKKFLKMFSANKSQQQTPNKNNMNPIAYYIKTNPYVNNILYNYVDKNIDIIQDSELREDLKMLLCSDNGFEITQAITLIATSKLFFS